MKRRNFIALVGAAAAWPITARGQQAKPIVGFLSLESSGSAADNRMVAFRKGLSETGISEGRDVSIEYRWAENQADRLPALAADLIGRKPVVIATGGGAAVAIAAKAATSTIPIVFATGGDPVKLGLVASFNRPGGNVTGISFLVNTMVPKQLEVLHEVVPKPAAIALLANLTNPSSAIDVPNAKAAAEVMGRSLIVVPANAGHDLESAFAAIVKENVGGLVVEPDPFFSSSAAQLAALAARNSLPAVFVTRDFAEAGGLMSYGTDVPDAYRQAGAYTGRVVKGERPANLPIQQLTRVEFVINLKTAKALGITFPLSLLGRADQVIE